MRYYRCLFLCVLSSLFLLFPPTASAQMVADADLGAAREAYFTNDVIVEFSGKADALIEGVENIGASVRAVLPEIGVAIIIDVDEKQKKRLEKLPQVKSANYDVEVQWLPEAFFEGEALRVPSGELPHEDPAQAYFFDQYQWNMRQIQAPEAWTIEKGNPDVRVCILDSGMSPTHRDLVGKYDIEASASFVVSEPFLDDLHYHGTFVAGLIATNNIGVSGVAPNVTLVGVKVLNYRASGTISAILQGIMYAVDEAGCDIINMSLGGYFYKNDEGRLHAMFAKAVNYANRAGALVVASAGNSGIDLDHVGPLIHIPSQSGRAFSVSATGPYNQANFDVLAAYSNYGVTGADIAAPGGGSPARVTADRILSVCSPNRCGNDRSYLSSSGTSFAAPIASGIAALMDSQEGGDLNAGQLSSRLRRSADDLGKRGVDSIYGHGRANALNAVE